MLFLLLSDSVGETSSHTFGDVPYLLLQVLILITHTVLYENIGNPMEISCM